MDVVYLAKDITETTTQWKCTGRPTIKLAALSTLFESHLKNNMNGGAHFTHLGPVSSNSWTSRSFTGFFIYRFLRVFGAHDIISNLPTSTLQENLTMVLELVYFDDERRIVQSTSKQIWDILYKEIVAPDILQTEGGEEDRTKSGDPVDNDDTDSDSEDIEDAPSVEEDSMNETFPTGRDTENDERECQDEVVGDSSAVGSKD